MLQSPERRHGHGLATPLKSVDSWSAIREYGSKSSDDDAMTGSNGTPRMQARNAKPQVYTYLPHSGTQIPIVKSTKPRASQTPGINPNATGQQLAKAFSKRPGALEAAFGSRNDLSSATAAKPSHGKAQLQAAQQQNQLDEHQLPKCPRFSDGTSGGQRGRHTRFLDSSPSPPAKRPAPSTHSNEQSTTKRPAPSTHSNEQISTKRPAPSTHSNEQTSTKRPAPSTHSNEQTSTKRPAPSTHSNEQSTTKRPAPSTHSNEHARATERPNTGQLLRRGSTGTTTDRRNSGADWRTRQAPTREPHFAGARSQAAKALHRAPAHESPHISVPVLQVYTREKPNKNKLRRPTDAVLFNREGITFRHHRGEGVRQITYKYAQLTNIKYYFPEDDKDCSCLSLEKPGEIPILFQFEHGETAWRTYVEKLPGAIELQSEMAMYEHVKTFTDLEERRGWVDDTQPVLTYPPGATDGVTIFQSDVARLEPGEFLNDTIIEFYFKYLTRDVMSDHQRSAIHIFSPFFYNRLSAVKGSGAEAAEEAHTRVQRWTRKVDIFEKDVIFVPINEHAHWYMAAIFYPGGVDEEARGVVDLVHDGSDDENDDDYEPWDAPRTRSRTQSSPARPLPVPKKRCIAIFDSLGGRGRPGVVRTLHSYLTREWATRRAHMAPLVFDKKTMPVQTIKLPQQDNYCDCGVFILQYVEQYLSHPFDNFEPKMDYSEWFEPAVVREKRDRIRQLILDFRESAAAQPPAATGGAGADSSRAATPELKPDTRPSSPIRIH